MLISADGTFLHTRLIHIMHVPCVIHSTMQSKLFMNSHLRRNLLISSKNQEVWQYSSVPKRRECTFIDFEKKNPPGTALIWSANLLFLRKNSHCTFIPPCMFIGICPAHLLILRKKIPPARTYFGLHVWCFLRIFLPAGLFHPTRLFSTLE